jgi:hypothetical protein
VLCAEVAAEPGDEIRGRRRVVPRPLDVEADGDGQSGNLLHPPREWLKDLAAVMDGVAHEDYLAGRLSDERSHNGGRVRCGYSHIVAVGSSPARAAHGPP